MACEAVFWEGELSRCWIISIQLRKLTELGDMNKLLASQPDIDIKSRDMPLKALMGQPPLSVFILAQILFRVGLDMSHHHVQADGTTTEGANESSKKYNL